MNCASCQNALPDLLLDPGSAVARAAEPHLRECPVCLEELTQLRSTMHLLDAWQAPEPTPWFDTRMSARLRQAQAAPPETLLERLRSTVQFSTGRHLRPALAGALAVVLLLGGGTAAELSGVLHKTPQQASSTVQDLQILDRNDQALQTMDQLLNDDGSSDDGGSSGSPAS